MLVFLSKIRARSRPISLEATLPVNTERKRTERYLYACSSRDMEDRDQDIKMQKNTTYLVEHTCSSGDTGLITIIEYNSLQLQTYKPNSQQIIHHTSTCICIFYQKRFSLS